MDDSRSTYSVLVVSAAAKFHTSLRELLPEDRYAPLCAASSVAAGAPLRHRHHQRAPAG